MFQRITLNRLRKPFHYCPKFFLLVFILSIIILTGCKKEIVPKVFWPRSDHEAYQHSLEEANLITTALGKDWVNAAQRSLDSPTDITLPHQEAFYISPKNPDAIGYRFFVKRGLRIEVIIRIHASDSLILFADLFRQIGDSIPDWIHVATADEDSSRLMFETRRDANYIFRLQPELLRGGLFDVVIREVPSLEFPVAGKNSRAILSFFGDSRDGGRREHHGVDIFAPRHTPVLAPIRAQVLRVGEGGIGGRYVWLYEPKRALYLYFAHLETQRVKEARWVNPGDTIGTVGNSGNAVRTSPHLHFGIYNRGPVDPWNFLAETDTIPDRIRSDTLAISKLVRLKKSAAIFTGPDLRSHSIDTLDIHSIMVIMSATGSMYRVLLPDGSTGYIPDEQVEIASDEIDHETLPDHFALLETPEQDGVCIANMFTEDQFLVLGQFNNFYFIRTPQGTEGWMSFTSQPKM